MIGLYVDRRLAQTGFELSLIPPPEGGACDNHPHSEPAVGMLDYGRVESTELVGFAQTPIVLNDSLRLRVPTDRLRRKS
jgi:hypothetical protein